MRILFVKDNQEQMNWWSSFLYSSRYTIEYLIDTFFQKTKSFESHEIIFKITFKQFRYHSFNVWIDQDTNRIFWSRWESHVYNSNKTWFIVTAWRMLSRMIRRSNDEWETMFTDDERLLLLHLSIEWWREDDIYNSCRTFLIDLSIIRWMRFDVDDSRRIFLIDDQTRSYIYRMIELDLT